MTDLQLFDADLYGRAHPCPFPQGVLVTFDRLLPARGRILDPFAGIGRVHRLARGARSTVGVELEPEWARARAGTIVGDATALPFADSTFDAIATSPAYGNRMADQSIRPAATTFTYAHALGRRCSPGSGAAMQWGDDYRTLHALALEEMIRVARPGAMVLINMKDHERDRVRQHVVDWWVDAIASRAHARLVDVLEVDTGGLGNQEHANDLLEVVIVARVGNAT